MEKKRNLWVIPTNKPSRLVKGETTGRLLLHDTYGTSTDRNETQNIYITSDEEIKDVRPHKGKWQLEKGEILNKFPNYLTDLSECKLVIMTTDQDLIKDGVQAIDDEFLEWFVNNPSCEEVKTEKLYNDYGETNIFDLVCTSHSFIYKIIIPKEEPNRTHYLDELPNIDKKILSKMWEDVVPELEPKQEKLEETIGLKAHEYSMQYVGTDKYTVSMLAIEFGYHLALEQEQEKSYSEEDMHNLMDEYQNWLFNTNTVVLTFREWFKQFKKK